MNVQAIPPTYTPAGGNPPLTGNAPVLGAQVPGMAGGLPPQGGLSVLSNPMAQELQSMGRDEDSMLVHMSPEEVNSLQGLAMAAGGSLTINPQTGFPEAFSLKKLLPMIAGVGLNFAIPGLGLAVKGLSTAAQAGLMTGAASTALTGNLQKGLMAGLGAFGGASLAGGIEGAVGGAKAGVGGAGPVSPHAAASDAIRQQAGEGIANVGRQAAQTAAQASPHAAAGSMIGAAPPPVPPPNALARFGQGFADTARGSMTGLAGKAAVPMAGLGVLSGISDATTPGFRTPQGQIDNSYQGPYTAQRRTAAFAPSTEDILGSSKERRYFDIDQPEIYNMQGQVVQPGSSTAPGTPIVQSYLLPQPKKKKRGSPMYGFRTQEYMPNMMGEEGFAKGGEVQLADGAFVVDARTVSEIGNGSSNAGMEFLSRMGGRPIDGPGDGVSDSIPARIGRDQPARVARDEVLFSPQAVRRVGNGSEKRGAQKLYALMDKAHKARRKSARGKDMKVVKGLGALA